MPATACRCPAATISLPVDALLEDETSLDFETISLDFVLRQLSRETKVRLVFLDACRNNPLAARGTD
jgi:uncharacterized caspase-like protein